MGRRPGPGRGRGRGRGQGSGQGPGPGRSQAPGQGQSKVRGQGQGRGPATGRGQAPGREQAPDRGQGQAPGPGRGPAAPLHFRKEKKLDNMKPKHPDEQEIPFRLRELMKSREAMKRPKTGKKQTAEKKQQPKSKVPKGQEDIPVPKFKRGKGESERSYICRMEQEVQRVLFLTKNQLQREPEKEEMAPEKSKRKKEFQNKKLEKARRKKEEKKEAMLEKSLFQDTVAFGEVVTQPPTITSRPKGKGPTEQAGRKQLLLTSRLGQSPASPAALVSMARQRIVAEERARVIQAYRDIQRRRQQQREAAQSSAQARHRAPR